MNAQEGENPFTNFEDAVDVTEDVQDWRFLSNAKVEQGNYTIPKRGEKDFEPDGTQKQEGILELSRKAMYDALSVERLISFKHVIIGVWNWEKKMACVEKVHGPFFKTMGQGDSKNRMWLLPEETLYLVERGSMECWAPDGVPMSLQSLYAATIPFCGSLENYIVYAHLRRCGFSVVRSRQIQRNYDNLSKSMDNARIGLWSVGMKKVLSAFHYMSYMKLWLPKCKKAHGLLPDKTYRDYRQVYEEIQVVPGYSPKSFSCEKEPEAPFQLTFDVYKPSQIFKKSSLKEPDFRICVVDAQSTIVPTCTQLNRLFGIVPIQENTSKHMMQRLKEGVRNVIFAVVDCGVVSYVRFSDVCMNENLFLEQPRKRGKGDGNRKGLINNNYNRGN
ncbi:tRNA-splicing endonuclease subunit Sen54 [Schizosaccharomyces cryophilus OY26]|uniref:tRNA-splicing endonuclease subunit Sen54 n=1 Tax=Schizosaccharomyces cryophilus (strain OY26 / ATCC MYA-4695 / CBS 11777 / NBRC 106824 / NRRL Y48691) TaxID=653667 RepID=S9X3B6_SCHCR|nr:tRNA-splicing endonuclease subunit Sen54 [Schizosaccharomyces cryophilus OY26]EPY51602.1 tRNA-splicing endonuclease subunit Sen54 [Schizosaccharomyces cryophilus OY26]